MLTVLEGDCRDRLRKLADESVHCVVTSPPYWGLRDYGTARWEGGREGCEHTGVRPPGENCKSATNRGSSRDPVSRTCRRCGAHRIDSQLGLESTPEEYIAAMVGVFREVRRVLRSDGTLWLNLGDSYAGSGPSGASYQSETTKRRAAGNGTDGNFRVSRSLGERGLTYAEKKPIPPPGLKPKDLCGIPWAVAKALQQPYYTGRIKRIEDRIWLAAMIDGEGCMFIHKRKTGQSNGQGYVRKNDSYGAGLEVSNTHESIVKRCQEITGLGSICFQDKESRLKNRNQRLFRWNLRSNECRNVIREIYPYLVGKQHEARLVLGCPSSGPDAEKAHASLIKLHNGFDPIIDFPAPASMFEQGWYLRSEIIWSKNNPMPESVTDRPTKAHEQVFLLAKSARYFYDAEAIKEQSTESSGWARQRANGDNTWKYNDTDERKSVTGQSIEASTFGAIGARNRRTVWTIATAPYSDAHFATFPPKLVEPCVLAGTSARGCCAECGAPWERVVERGELNSNGRDKSTHGSKGNANQDNGWNDNNWKPGHSYELKTTGWQPTCTHLDADVVPAVVLDPFAGSGTVGKVALELGRRAVLIELNPKYCEMIERRNQVTLGLPGLA